MRLIPIHESEIEHGCETYQTDGVDHSVYLHTRMWPYTDPLQPRARFAYYEHERELFFDIGFIAPQSFVDVETAKLGEATKITVFQCGDDAEFVAMTEEDEIVQVISRWTDFDFMYAELYRFEHVTLLTRTLEDYEVDHEYIREMNDIGLESECDPDDLSGTKLNLRLELSDRYLAEAELPSRQLVTGDGALCDIRDNWMGAVSIVQRVNEVGEVVDIGMQVFKHPMGDVFGMPGLPTPADVEAWRAAQAGEPRRPRRSARKRRRRPGPNSYRGLRGRLKRHN